MMSTKYSVITMLIVLINLVSCKYTEKQKDITSDEAKSELSKYLGSIREAYRLPALGVGIVSGNQVYFENIGYADLSRSIPVNESTVYFTGNVSELVVATAIAKLASQGKLNLNDPVTKHLPYFKLGDKNPDDILISHMLTQTSGIPKHDAVWDMPYYNDDALENTTRSIASQQPEFTPGSKVKRSQYNFDILADLVSKVGGGAYEKFMDNNVFLPLGMPTATLNPLLVDSIKLAKPHVMEDWMTWSRKTSDVYPYNRENAGSIGFHSSVKDITTWMKSLVSNEENFWSVQLRESILTEQYQTGKSSFVGFGWEIVKHKERILFKDHNLGGFSANVTIIPERRIGVFVVTNTSDGFNPALISNDIIQWLSEDKLPKIKIPVGITLGQKLRHTNSIDSVLNYIDHLKNKGDHQYDISEQSLTDFGVTLLHKLHREKDATRIYEFIQREYPSSCYAHINLAEVYVLNGEISKAQSQIELAEKRDLSPEAGAHILYLKDAISIKMEKKEYGISDMSSSME